MSNVLDDTVMQVTSDNEMTAILAAAKARLAVIVCCVTVVAVFCGKLSGIPFSDAMTMTKSEDPIPLTVLSEGGAIEREESNVDISDTAPLAADSAKDEVAASQPIERTATLGTSIFNLTNSIVGKPVIFRS